MRVVRLHGAGDVRLHDEHVPVPAADESLVRVTAVGICGSDVHWFSEAAIGDARLEKALVLGHEFAGVVENGELRGQHVAVDPLISCDHCEPCREGKPNLCPAQRFAGHALQDGALREYLPWPTRFLHPLPDSMTDEDGAMLEPLGIAIHTVDLAHIQLGMTVAVFGCGPIGLLIVQVARLAGAARCIATEKLPHRIRIAESLGAEVIPAADGKEAYDILKATRGRGVDVAFEAAGDNTAVEAAVVSAKPGGRILLAGIPDQDLTAFTASTARRKELILQCVRRMRHTYPRAMNLAVRGMVEIRSLVTHRFPLERTDEAFASAQRRDGLKVVVRP